MGIKRRFSTYYSYFAWLCVYGYGVWNLASKGGIWGVVGVCYGDSYLWWDDTIYRCWTYGKWSGAVGIVLVSMINARQIFYSISMLERFKQMGKKSYYMIYSLTDETPCLISKAQGHILISIGLIFLSRY